MKRSKLIKGARRRLLAAGADPDELTIMLGGGDVDVDPAMLDLYLRQTLHLGPAPEPKPVAAAPPMDGDRVALHREAKEEARVRCAANPALDKAAEYADAVVRILDRADPTVIF